MSKVALVTGTFRGIGRDIAEKLLANGFTVYCADRPFNDMNDLAAKGGKILSLDCNCPQSIEDAVKIILEESGGVDILINNAGYGLYGAVETVPSDAGRAQMEVNFFAPVYLTKLLLPAMRKRGGGRIINVTSVAGRVYSPLSAWYCASKYALEGLTDCLRLELKQFNIKTILVEPSPIKTAWSATAKETLQTYSKNTAYETFGEKSYALLAGATDKMASEPSVVVNALWRAVTAKNPKPRYLCGKMARISVLTKGLMGTRLFDKTLHGQLK